MSHTSPRARAGLLVLAVGATLTLPALPAAADEDAQACLDAGNVWVVVQQGDAVDDGCATEFANGIEALTSAGFEPDVSDGFVAKIDAEPSDPGPEDWWSYWFLEPGGEWVSYQVGAEESEPEAGTVQGWRLWDSYSTQAEAPTVDPLAADGESSGEATPSESAAPEATEATETAETEATDSADAEATTSEDSGTTDADTSEGDDDGLPVGTLVGVGALVVLAAVGVLLWIRRRPTP